MKIARNSAQKGYLQLTEKFDCKKTRNSFVIISQNSFVMLAKKVSCGKHEMIVGFQRKTISRTKREIISRI